MLVTKKISCYRSTPIYLTDRLEVIASEPFASLHEAMELILIPVSVAAFPKLIFLLPLGRSQSIDHFVVILLAKLFFLVHFFGVLGAALLRFMGLKVIILLRQKLNQSFSVIEKLEFRQLYLRLLLLICGLLISGELIQLVQVIGPDSLLISSCSQFLIQPLFDERYRICDY